MRSVSSARDAARAMFTSLCKFCRQGYSRVDFKRARTSDMPYSEMPLWQRLVDLDFNGDTVWKNARYNASKGFCEMYRSA